MRSSPRMRHGAFSLVEILIATGLFSVAALAIGGLLLLSGSQESEARDETRATTLAAGILENLALPDNPRMVRVAVGMKQGRPVWKEIDPKNTVALAVSYDEQGNPIRELDPDRSGEPDPDGDAFAIAFLTFHHLKTDPSLVTVKISVGSPAAAPGDHRHTCRFVRRIASATP